MQKNKLGRFIFSTTLSSVALGIGYCLGKKSMKKSIKCYGTLRIDDSEKDISERLFLELDNDLKDIEKAKVIQLRVVKDNYVKSQ